MIMGFYFLYFREETPLLSALMLCFGWHWPTVRFKSLLFEDYAIQSKRKPTKRVSCWLCLRETRLDICLQTSQELKKKEAQTHQRLSTKPLLPVSRGPHAVCFILARQVCQQGLSEADLWMRAGRGFERNSWVAGWGGADAFCSAGPIFKHRERDCRRFFLLRSVSQFSIISPKRHLKGQEKKAWISVVVPEEDGGDESWEQWPGWSNY